MEHGFTLEEVRQEVMSMGSLKAPGKDGYQPVFFHKCWSTVGEALFWFVGDCFVNPMQIGFINETLLVLIPKKESPEYIAQFRPIGLCNVVYQTLAKCIVNRIKPHMRRLVHPTQTYFVSGRHITDIIIVQEVVHSMGLKKGKKGQMFLKIDQAKAYDKLSWRFLHETLVAAGIPTHLTSVIMACVSSSSMQVMWNGGATEGFTPSRGLRQGCPLSPYLFTLCKEILSHVIQEAVVKGAWKTIKASPGGPSLSHLFFADDLILFAEASEE
ncbi:unnamed protein product [Linum trigynum]|uniref:Reverse transcriptase domain-containing protein n=1 Tax=Linum trigynum TaxID=586398 RepID=A0AAV2CFI0_9ROSI